MFFFEGEHVDISHTLNSDKIRTSPQPGPRNAWIGNPHHRNCMVEVGTWNLPAKGTPKKNRNQKNSTVIDREFDFLSITVEFSASGFFFRCTFTGKLPPASEFCQGYSNKFSTAVDRL
jgi:hypothetical protein